MIEIDLNARVLPEEHNVFVVRPGNSYGLFAEITQQNVLLLELPALGLESGTRPDDDDLRRRVNRSRALRAWYGGTLDENLKPNLDLATYSATEGGPSTAQLAALVRTFFERMKPGDLVVVPPKSYMEDAWIGEIASESYVVEPVKVARLYGDEILSGRAVRWITRIPKRDLPYEILDALQKPSAAFLVERSLRSRFYKVAYGNYSISDFYSAKFEVTEADFDTVDDVLLQAFFNFVAANTRAVQEPGQQVLGFGAAAFKDSGDFIPKLQTNVNSPGDISLVSKVITPLVASVLFLLAVDVGPSAKAEAEQGTLILRNSKAAENDPCTAKVVESSMQILKLLNLDDWPEACQRAQEVAKKTGLKSPARVEKRQ
ncbi:hypothetical protein LRP30_16120 [Bradyrhizobium sp. C-145]|uniref:hypothetical protein n=1 Tax=Bradyrhizobium sp. C-145 TaxID=574727 RepID=UPI00201B563E|nr:hypothetical protein [Bradyrhizobium sp. C-145]UQR66681.1 hypothetical protein LRP30_16120 [Bradyrhizobium sp. C-145]